MLDRQILIWKKTLGAHWKDHDSKTLLKLKQESVHFKDGQDIKPTEQWRPQGFLFRAQWPLYVLFCGGKLKNWEPGDDPWVEHAMWFPKCAFLRKKKNEIFVEVIVGRQNETQVSGAASEGSQQTITKSETQAKPQTISQTELSSLQAENSQLNNQFTCKVCLDKNISVAFLPCGHLACCLDCAPAMRKCPICRSNIKGTVRTYIRYFKGLSGRVIQVVSSRGLSTLRFLLLMSRVFSTSSKVASFSTEAWRFPSGTSSSSHNKNWTFIFFYRSLN